MIAQVSQALRNLAAPIPPILNAITGLLTITYSEVTYGGVTQFGGTVTMTLIVKDDSTLTVQSGATLTVDGVSYDIITTEMSYSYNQD